MITKDINFQNFKLKKKNIKIKKDLKILLKEKNHVLKSLMPSYKNSYTEKKIKALKNYSNIRVIGMGGSILGTETIYYFLRDDQIILKLRIYH